MLHHIQVTATYRVTYLLGVKVVPCCYTDACTRLCSTGIDVCKFSRECAWQTRQMAANSVVEVLGRPDSSQLETCIDCGSSYVDCFHAGKFFWFLLFMVLTLLYFTFYGIVCVAMTPSLLAAAVVSNSLYVLLGDLFSGCITPQPVSSPACCHHHGCLRRLERVLLRTLFARTWCAMRSSICSSAYASVLQTQCSTNANPVALYADSVKLHSSCYHTRLLLVTAATALTLAC